jgi:hypothetical protein
MITDKSAVFSREFTIGKIKLYKGSHDGINAVTFGKKFIMGQTRH